MRLILIESEANDCHSDYEVLNMRIDMHHLLSTSHSFLSTAISNKLIQLRPIPLSLRHQ